MPPCPQGRGAESAAGRLNRFMRPGGFLLVMAFLSEPDEDRLWVVIAVLLGTAIVLLFASYQVPWYSATWTTSDVEFQGSFDFNEAHIQIMEGGQELDSQYVVYSDQSGFGDLMDRTGVLVGLGTFAALAMGALLFAHYRGWYSQPKLIALSWLLGAGGIAAGVTIFMLGAGRAGADEVERLLSTYAPEYAPLFGRPDSVFWGSQTYAGGDMVSAPGVGWLLAVLALFNLAAATLLLYQFPAGSLQEEDADVASFQVVQEDKDRSSDAPMASVADGPPGRG